MAYLGTLLAVLSLASQIGMVGYLYANVLAEQNANKADIARNFTDDKENRERSLRNIDRIDNTIGTMSKLHVDIEVLKTQLTTMNDTLRRLEKRFEPRGKQN